MAAQEVIGVVVSDKMAKTVVVAIERQIRHEVYGKAQRLTSKFTAPDESNVSDVKGGSAEFQCSDFVTRTVLS